MKLEGDWFSVRLSTWPGRMAARMWAFAVACEGPGHDTLAKAVLNEVGREEHKE